MEPGQEGWQRYENLIGLLASPRSSWRVPHEDLKQAGRIGAWRALQTYDPRRGVKEATWVYRGIYYAMQHLMRDTLSVISIPAYVQEQVGRRPAGTPLPRGIVNILNPDALTDVDYETIPDRREEGWELRIEGQTDTERMIARLEGRQRQVASLIILQGLTLTEAGRRIGLSANTTSHHFARARARLRWIASHECSPF